MSIQRNIVITTTPPTIPPTIPPIAPDEILLLDDTFPWFEGDREPARGVADDIDGIRELVMVDVCDKFESVSELARMELCEIEVEVVSVYLLVGPLQTGDLPA